MLVSHRNMISVFDMTESSGDVGSEYDVNGRFIQTLPFVQGFIRQMFIKERPKAELKRLIEETADEVDPNFAHK